MPSITIKMLFHLLWSFLFFAGVLADLRSELNKAGVAAVFPGDDEYAAAAKAFNIRFDPKPKAVAYPKSSLDVSKVVGIAFKNEVSVSARSGGHSYTGDGLAGSLVVDLANMKGITLDPSTHVAKIETGNRLGNIAKSLNSAGRALPHGTCPYVGIGGHSAYGGFGYTSRMWGLTLDTIQAIDAVLANGTVVRATKDVNPDLFWAFRGAAPSYGIVTSIEVVTFPAPNSSYIFTYEWSALPNQAAATALLAFQTYAQHPPSLSSAFPSELGFELVLQKGERKGTVDFALQGGLYGKTVDSLKNILDPLIKAMHLPKPDTPLTIKGDGSYIDTVRVLAEEDGGLDMNGPDTNDQFYAKSIMIPQGQPLSQQGWDAYLEYMSVEGYDTTLDWFVEVQLFGGENSKINVLPVDSTSFRSRDTLINMQLYASKGESRAFPRDAFTFLDDMEQTMISAMPKNWDYGAYANYLDERQENWQQRYFGSHYQRLQKIKKQVDPQNMFAFPNGIKL